MTDKFCGSCGYPIKRPTQDQQTTSNNQNGKNVPPQIEKTEIQAIFQLNDEMKSLKNKQMNYYKNYGYCIVGFDDADPRILSRVRKYLLAGKIDTLEEALKRSRRR